MPEIKRFGGSKLFMFFQDENPPHVHIKGPGFAAKIRLSNGEVIAGEAPGKALRTARRWIVSNRVRLMQLWDEFQE
jgi:uncharacterized protein DUF4160